MSDVEHLTSGEACFSNLEKLYRDLEAALPQTEGNPCGSCRECCTGQGLNQHNVTALELDYIGARVGPEKLPEFRQFLARDGQVALCPYFDVRRWGCGIYPHRPYSCRVFGHHRSQTTALPSVCVFRGQEKIFQVADYFEEVPLASELRGLARDYWPFQELPQHSQAETPAGTTTANMVMAGDALDRALVLTQEGQLQEALETFESSELPSTPYVLYCLSLVFEGLGRHADACTALSLATGQAPDCPPLWFRLACNLYSDQRFQEAESAFSKTIALRPDHALAHGLLGGHLLRTGLREKAAEHLTIAARLEPDCESYSRLLAQAL